MKEKPLMAFLMERGVRENYSFFFAHKEDQWISPKRRLQDSRKKQVDHRDKILSGLFQQHRLLAKVLLLRWPFQLASMAKYYCFVGQVLLLRWPSIQSCFATVFSV